MPHRPVSGARDRGRRFARARDLLARHHSPNHIASGALVPGHGLRALGSAALAPRGLAVGTAEDESTGSRGSGFHGIEVVRWLRLSGAMAVLALGCAEGVASPVDERTGSAVAPGPVGTDAGADAGSVEAPRGDAPSSPAIGGDPCARGETLACDCPRVEEQGERQCLHDAASPLDGFFGDCEGCPDPPDHTCDDGEKNGFETGDDCGGPECDPCGLGKGCITDDDCARGVCEGGACEEPTADPGPAAPPPPTGPTPASPTGAVADCTGQPMGTPCSMPLAGIDCIGSLTPQCSGLDTCLCLL